MHTLRVSKEPFGWTIRLGAGMTSSFRTRAQAMLEAECLCDELRRHGEEAEVLIEESRMPYRSVEDLPISVQAHLPRHAQQIFRSAFNSAWSSYSDQDPDHREETAHRVAWAAVKRRYRKEGADWVER